MSIKNELDDYLNLQESIKVIKNTLFPKIAWICSACTDPRDAKYGSSVDPGQIIEISRDEDGYVLGEPSICVIFATNMNRYDRCFFPERYLDMNSVDIQNDIYDKLKKDEQDILDRRNEELKQMKLNHSTEESNG